MASFGEWVKERRRAIGLRRQEDLATLVDVTQSTVSSWETGDAFPDRDRIPALAAALQVDPEEVLARAYDASYGTVGELRKNLREILGWVRRQELNFESVATTLEGMTRWSHQVDYRLGLIEALLRRLEATNDEATPPPDPPSGNPHPSAKAALETPSRLRR